MKGPAPNFRISSIHCFVSIDPSDNSEGLMAFLDVQSNKWMPMVCADEERLASMYPIAESLLKGTGRAYNVLKFSVREDVTEQIKERFKK